MEHLKKMEEAVNLMQTQLQQRLLQIHTIETLRSSSYETHQDEEETAKISEIESILHGN